jgi:hypothetical protein
MRNIWITVFLVLAGASSTYLPQAGGSEPDRTRRSSSDDELHQASKPIDDPIAMLQYFLHPLSPSKTNVILRGCEEPVADNVYFEPPLQFKIATLPDPDRTHLSLYFDRWLESILEAAHDADYRFIGYWLPWSADLPKTDLRPSDQAKADEDSERRSTQPGMLLFRRPDHKAALVFFLVGETPTGGINRRQFANAACYIAELSGGASPKVVDVLGPQFSGSVSSFEEAVLHDLPPAIQIGNVVSGVMSGEPALSRMQAARQLRSGETFTLQHNTSYLGAAAERARQVLDLKGKMAVLAEGGTDYGSAVGYGANTDDSLTIYYPREISRLRNSYPEQSYATNAAARSSGIPDLGLTLRLHDVRTGTDTVPEFSLQTPVTQEATMLQITRTLTRENVSLAVIGGTDVLDLLFISRFMRNNCPDIRLMIYASDVLFVHGLDTLDFTGTLALSTYPLFSDNLRWSVRQRANKTVNASTRRFFSSYTAEGIYNATLALLESKEGVREYSGAMDPSGGTNAPPAWLTVIGRDGYWPVGILLPVSDPMLPGHDPFIADVPGGIARFEPAIPTRAWKALFCLLSAAAGFYAAIFVYAVRVRDARNHPLPRWCCAIHPEPLRLVSLRAHYSFLLSVTILLAYLTVVIAPFRLAAADGGQSWVLMCRFAAIVTSLLLAVSFYGARWCRKSAITFVTLPALLTVMVYGSLLLRGSFRHLLAPVEQSAMTLFRAIRSVQIDSGVAPNVPLFLVCVAFSWWAWVQIRRFILQGELYQTPPPPPEGCSKSLADLDRWLSRGFLHIDEFGWLLFGSALATILLISERAAGTVESAQFSHLLCVLIAFLGALLFLTAYCILRIWFVLHRLLNALDDNPIREAFSAMPQEISWAQVWSHGVISPSYKAVVATVESFRALRECERTYYPALENDVNRLQTAAATILRRANSGEREELAEIKEYQAASGKITRKLSDQLAERGWRAAVSGTFEKLANKQVDGTIQKAVARWFGAGAKVEVQSSPSDPVDKADQLAAEIVALRYAAYIRYVMRHLRNLVEFLTYGFIFCALAVNSYPFQALTVIRWSVTLVSLPLGGVVLYLFMKMSRDAILSRLSSTEAGRLDRDFYTRFLSTGALPLLTVVGSHFPSVGRFLLSWIQPAISAVH